ncbi:MAG: CPBP family intramembrane glutamic endopeptidase [Nitrospirota bacterium]
MNLKSISGYLTILFLSFFLHAVKPSNHGFHSALPVIMIIYPVAVGHKVKIRFSPKDFAIGAAVSVIILLPYYFIRGGDLQRISAYFVILQLLSVSLPEEFFFRGFLQDSAGRHFRAVLFVSLLFSFAHLPKAVFLGEWISLLSFFPSIVMGWLYMKTNNILPGTLFHLFSNIVHQSAL